jgi:predicted amidohydrolase YtcJ
MQQADLILRNGDIWTNTGAPVRSVAVVEGRIAAVGDDAEKLAGPKTRVIELGGHTVLPALTDAHAHLFGLGMALDQVDLRGCSSPDECAARVKVHADREWILGRGWDQNRWDEKAFPTHAVLDRVVADKPVWLRRVDGHAGWANAKALAMGGVTRATKDPSGGRIERDSKGEPTGVLVDEAMGLVERAMPAPSEAARERMILAAQDAALAQGLTCVHDMGIDETTAGVYRALEKSGKLRIRVYAFASAGAGERLLAKSPEPAGPLFTMRAIKLYADGALGSRGAALLAPYTDDPKNTGLVIQPAEEIERVARLALARGWQVGVHAIGDRANRTVLDAYERAGCAVARDHRFRIEHAQVVEPSDIPRFAKLGVIASMQPTHATSDMPWAEARLGKDRLVGAYAWRRFLDAGAHVAFGSDFPVEMVDPTAGLYAAVTRQDAQGQPPGGWLPDQKLTLAEAVRAFTAEAAFAAFQEADRGRVAVGQVADLTIFDRAIDAKTLSGAKIALTIVAGRVVFEHR